MRLLVLILLTSFSLSHGNVTVPELLDAFENALAAAGSVTADIESTESFDGKPATMLRGLLTIQGGEQPRFRFTGARQQLPKKPGGSAKGTSTQAVSDSGKVAVASGAEQILHESPLASLGGHLLGAKLDPDFLLLLYPELLDELRGNPRAQVEQQTVRNRLYNVLTVEGPNGRFTIQLDAQTHLPTRIERAEKTWRGTRLSALMLENIRISSKRPLSELFQLPLPPGFSQEVYRPGKIGLGDKAPVHLLELHSGEFLDLESTRGRPLILFFSAEWSDACRKMMPQIHQVAERAAASDMEFIELDVWPIAPASKGNPVPWPRAAGDRAAILYGVQELGVPTVFFVDASGVVQEILTGYLPGLTEEALDRALSNLQESPSVRPEEP